MASSTYPLGSRLFSRHPTVIEPRSVFTEKVDAAAAKLLRRCPDLGRMSPPVQVKLESNGLHGATQYYLRIPGGKRAYGIRSAIAKSGHDFREEGNDTLVFLKGPGLNRLALPGKPSAARRAIYLPGKVAPFVAPLRPRAQRALCEAISHAVWEVTSAAPPGLFDLSKMQIEVRTPVGAPLEASLVFSKSDAARLRQQCASWALDGRTWNFSGYSVVATREADAARVKLRFVPDVQSGGRSDVDAWR